MDTVIFSALKLYKILSMTPPETLLVKKNFYITDFGSPRFELRVSSRDNPVTVDVGTRLTLVDTSKGVFGFTDTYTYTFTSNRSDADNIVMSTRYRDVKFSIERLLEGLHDKIIGID